MTHSQPLESTGRQTDRRLFFGWGGEALIDGWGASNTVVKARQEINEFVR